MAESTQSQHPWRASVRTGLTTAILVLSALAAGMPEIVSFVSEQWPDSPAAAIVVSASGVVVGASVLVNRVILLSPVAALLESLGLGPAPKGEDAVIVDEAPGTTPVAVIAVPDEELDEGVLAAPADTEGFRAQLAALGFDRVQKLFDNE